MSKEYLEALKCLEKLKGMEISSMPFSDEYGTQEVDLNDIRKVGSQLNTDFREYIDTIKQALLKAQEKEKEKLLFKNIHNTKVKTPLVSIFEGLSKDERFKFTEHIYYHWEEMKEALEDKNNELEKENARSEEILQKYYREGITLDSVRALKQERDNYKKVLDIIKEKRIDIESFYTSFIEGDYNYSFYDIHYGTYGKYCLTEEEFYLLKRWLGE